MKRSGQAISLAGLVAAVALAIVGNTLAARHFKRWDWTTGKRYTLSQATVETLHSLETPIELWVLLGGGDPLEPSVKQLLVAYQSETSRLDIHYVDPDKDPIAFGDVQRRFKIEAGRTTEGRVVTDAVIVAARGERHWFVTASDLFEVTSNEDARAKPREEQAITGAIRSVLSGDKARLCFTTGHGELSIDPTKEGWIGELRSILEKDNFELSSVDTTLPNAHEPFKGCDVAVIARPESPFTKDEENRLRTWLMEGGSVLACVGPINADTESGMRAPGLADALAPFGIALDEELVIDAEPSVSIPESHGEGFFVAARPHAVTQALVEGGAVTKPPKIALFVARPLRHDAKDGSAAAIDLLATTDKAFAKTSIRGASKWTDVPEKQAGDPSGPFVVGMASERPKPRPSAARGPRAVVVGSGFAMADENWRQPRALRGTAFFVENALSWLSARPAVLDVPPKAEVAAGMRITDESRREVRNYVLIYMPLAALLLALAVAFRRRSTEGEAYKKREAKP
jgi:hypothetical protein